MIRINFQPYTTTQLETIVHARLAKSREGLPAKAPEVISKDGAKFASMKVSSFSGGARRVLDICRYVYPPGISSRRRPTRHFFVDRRTVEFVQPRKKTAGTMEVKEVISAMQNSPTAGYLQELSFHEKVTLTAVLQCVAEEEGVDEVKWGGVSYPFDRVRMHAHSSFFVVRFSTNTSFTR